MARDDQRPRPLMDAARDGATPPTTVGTVLAALAIGVILYRTDAGIDPINLAAGIVAVVATGGTSLYTVLRVLRSAESRVTPVDDPRTSSGEQLVPRSSALLGEILEQLLELRGAPAEPPPADYDRGGPRPPDPPDHVEAYDWAEVEPSPPRHARTQQMPAVDREPPPPRPRRAAPPAEAMPPADPDWYGDEITTRDEQRATRASRRARPAEDPPIARTSSGQLPAAGLLTHGRSGGRRRAQ